MRAKSVVPRGAAAAAIVGVLLATWMQNLLLAAAPQSLPRLDAVAMDARVLGYTALVALVTGLLFGVIPVWQAGHSHPADALAGAGRVIATASVMRWRNALMLTQVALSAILLVGVDLSVVGAAREPPLHRLPSLGFDPERVVAMRIVLPETRYPTAGAPRRCDRSDAGASI